MKSRPLKFPKFRKSLRGLTIIELAIAIATLSILFLVLFGVNFTVAKITNTYAPKSLQRSRAIMTLQMIQDSIRMSFYLPEENRTFFIGKSGGSKEERSDQLTLTSVARSPDAKESGVVREISFFLKKDTVKGGILYIREKPYADPEIMSGGEYYELLDNVKSFALSYSLNGRDWKDNWDSNMTKKLPRLVRITIQMENLNSIETFETVAVPGFYFR